MKTLLIILALSLLSFADTPQRVNLQSAGKGYYIVRYYHHNWRQIVVCNQWKYALQGEPGDTIRLGARANRYKVDIQIDGLGVTVMPGKYSEVMFIVE